MLTLLGNGRLEAYKSQLVKQKTEIEGKIQGLRAKRAEEEAGRT